MVRDEPTKLDFEAMVLIEKQSGASRFHKPDVIDGPGRPQPRQEPPLDLAR